MPAKAANDAKVLSLSEAVESINKSVSANAQDTFKTCPYNVSANYPGWLQWFLGAALPALGKGYSESVRVFY